MDVKVIKHNLIELIPTTDADKALLGLWSEQTARIASSTFANSETTGVCIQFSAIPPNKPQQPTQTADG